MSSFGKLTIAEKLAQIERENLAAARIVLADPTFYRPGSLMYQWAEKLMEQERQVKLPFQPKGV